MYQNAINLTHKQLETHGYILNTIATDTLVLKHCAISIHIADEIFIVLDQFYADISYSKGITLENVITFKKKNMSC